MSLALQDSKYNIQNITAVSFSKDDSRIYLLTGIRDDFCPDVNIEVLYYFFTKLNSKFLYLDKKQRVEQNEMGTLSQNTEQADKMLEWNYRLSFTSKAYK